MQGIAVLAALVLLQPVNVAVQDATPAARVVPPTYEEFVALDIPQRRELFVTLSPELKIRLVQTHGERWLASQRGRLSPDQTQAIEAFIRYIPEIFHGPSDRAALQKELELTKTIRCRVGENAFAEAFAILHPPQERRQGWRDVVDSWLEWVVECCD